jgi:hypothetical protein
MIEDSDTIHTSLVGCAAACEQLVDQLGSGELPPLRARARALARECALACRFAAQLLQDNSPVAVFQLGAIFMISQVCGDACSDVESHTEFRRCALV